MKEIPRSQVKEADAVSREKDDGQKPGQEHKEGDAQRRAERGLEAGRGAEWHLDCPIRKHGNKAQGMTEPKPACGFDRERKQDEQTGPQGEERFARPTGRRLEGLGKVVAARQAKETRQNERPDAQDRQQQETL